eukprot:gene17089-19481_t
MFMFLLGVFYTSLDRQLDRSGLVSNLLEVKDYFVENADQKSRLSEYCNIEVPKREVMGSYGIPGWELQHLAINIRHGDRSALHRIPGTTTPPVTLTDKNSSYLDVRAREYTHHFKCLHLEKLSLPNSTDAVYDGEEEFEHDIKAAVNPKKAFLKSDFLLEIGQLTTRGFMQHIQLGEQFKRYYGDKFLQSVTHSGSIYVRSTNYARTVQSVSGLLIAMLPQLFRNKKHKLPIHYYPNDSDEVMHGLVVRTHTKEVPGNHSEQDIRAALVETVPKLCPAVSMHAKNQKLTFAADSKLMKGLSDKLGPQITTKSIAQLTDAALPGFCHAQPLPCRTRSKPGDQKSLLSHLRGDASATEATTSVREMLSMNCLSENNLEDMMDECDREYCGAFAGTDGGLSATSLSIYPFLREITLHLVSAALHGEVSPAASAAAAVTPPVDVSDIADSESRRTLKVKRDKKNKKNKTSPSAAGGTGTSGAAESGKKKARSTPPPPAPARVSVFSGHDTVIAPVLAGLGVYRDHLCRWPGYASSIVFELWQPAKNNTLSPLSPPVQAGAAASVPQGLKTLFPSIVTPAPGETISTLGQTYYANSFVRVFFNGEDVTQRIPACVAERDSENAASQSVRLQQIQASGLTLCSLEALVTQVGSLIHPHPTITHACAHV